MQDNTSHTYNGRGSTNQQGSNSTNGISKRVSTGGSKGNNGQSLHGEKHHLLNLTDSELNDSAEDLRLPLPPVAGSSGGNVLQQGKSFKTSAGAITNGVTTAAGRIRRKIRLKRRQRDSRANSSNTLLSSKADANGEINSSTHSEGQGSSDSHTGDSDFCYPAATACCLCLPPTSIFGSSLSSSKASNNKYQYNKSNQRSHHQHRQHQHHNHSANPNHHYFHQPVKHSMVIATVFVFFTVAFVGLSYFAFNLQGQISTLSMHLEPVVEERKMISDNNHRFRSQLSTLSSNQTQLKNNISSLVNQLGTISSQLMQLNSSVVNLLEALNAAPYLKTLPGEVSDLQKQVAQFGSRLTDLESQLTKSETDLKSDLGDIKHDMASNKVIQNLISQNSSFSQRSLKNPENVVNNTQLKGMNDKLNELDTKLENLDSRFTFFGTNLTGQLQQQEERASKSWRLFADLQDDIQNVSAKAYSNEIRFQKTQSHLSTLEKNISDISQKLSQKERDKTENSQKKEDN